MTTWNLEGMQQHVFICNGGNCNMNHQADEVTLAIRDEIASLGADRFIHTTRTQCQGRCDDACVVTVYPEGVWYKEVTVELGRQIISEHLLKGQRVENQISYTFEQSLVHRGESALGIDKKGACSQR